jgi:hypothetical protein
MFVDVLIVIKGLWQSYLKVEGFLLGQLTKIKD